MSTIIKQRQSNTPLAQVMTMRSSTAAAAGEGEKKEQAQKKPRYAWKPRRQREHQKLQKMAGNTAPRHRRIVRAVSQPPGPREGKHLKI